MEDRGRNDAQIARDRCIEALAGSSDPAERLALWKAAKRYNERMRLEGVSGDYANPLRTRDREVALSGASAARELKS